MAIDNFIPEVWTNSILSNLDKALVYAQTGVVNTDYEGDISRWGDTVRINSIGRVSVNPYTKNSPINDPEVLSGFQTSLLIDQAEYFNFMIDDIDGAQTKPKVMSEATQEAAYALADSTDQFVAGLYTSAGKTIGTDSAPESVTSANAYDYLVDLSVLLSQKSTDANAVEQGGVPTNSRWVVVDPEFHGKLRKDDRFVHANKAGTDETLRNGEVGEAAGFRILVSNNVPTFTTSGTSPVTSKKIIAGHPMAWTFAEQINSTEAYRPDSFFSDALRGLHLYGAKVVRPEALAVLSVATS